jgi:hypothetical protein
VHCPGVEPEPIAWKAIILPLDQQCGWRDHRWIWTNWNDGKIENYKVNIEI